MIRPDNLTNEDLWAMFVACYEGDLGSVKALVARRPELVKSEYNYTPPIHFAVREGHLEVVRYLLEQGAEASDYRTYPFQDSLLTMAADREYRDIVDLLLTHAESRFPVLEGLAEFLDAVQQADVDLVRQALANKPELARASDDTGDTALHRAASIGHFELLGLLLDAGAAVNEARADGFRPMHCAFHRGRKSAALAGAVAGMLLARGANYDIYAAAVLGDLAFVRKSLESDPALANFDGTFRAISAAARRNDLAMVKLLLDHGADPSLPEHGAPDGQALWIAVYQGQHEMAKLLLEHGANPNTAPESSGSAISHTRHDPELRKLLVEYGAREESSDGIELSNLLDANDVAGLEKLIEKHGGIPKTDILGGPANRGQGEMILMLIRHGARVPDVSQWGRYYYFKHTHIARLLLENGMNPNHMTWHRVTMLHDMAQEGDLEKARLLLDHGADINALDEEYRSTPLGLAARWGRREMVALLLERGADPHKSGAPWSAPLAWARKKGHREIEAALS